MTISEQQRHQLHSTLETTIGTQEAATLMEYLPPVGWADIARQRDVDQLRNDIKSEIEAAIELLTSRMNELVTRSQNRILLVMMGTMLTTVIAVSGIAFAAAGLT